MAQLNIYTIDETEPLPEYDGVCAKAYAVKGRANSAGSFMALVVTSHLPHRGDLISSFQGLNHVSLCDVHEAGVMDWPLTGNRHYALIYDLALGRRLAPMGVGGHGAFTALKEDSILEHFVKPLGQGVSQLVTLGLFHGSIRADTVFISDAASGGKRVIIGDCLAGPCGYGQPAQYETIERAMASDIARGRGTGADDYYALGVTILAALLGDMPLKGLSAESVVQLKMERGSYAALVGERRFSSAVTELLRGLLADDPKQRWSVADFDMWVSGRRLTPKQSAIAKKASRPLRFANQEYFQIRQLLNAMAGDTKLAAAVITNQELSRWLGHGFADEKSIKYLDEAVLAARRQRGGSEEERLVTNVQIALDPTGPIRYRGLSYFPGGVPALLADQVLKDVPAQLLAESLASSFPDLWLGYQLDKKADLISDVQLCENTKNYLQSAILGSGVERALYETNPMLHCLNPQIRDRYVTSPKQLLEALDRRAAQGGLQIIERHIAAFLLARDKKISTILMQAIDQTRDMQRRNIAIMTLYSDLQHRYGPDSLKNLGALLLPLTEEAVKRFHNRPRQERVRKDLKKAAQDGSLIDMLRLIDDPKTIENDEEEFAAAKILYQQTEDEIERLALYAKNKKMLADQAGQPLAAVISVGLSFILLFVILLRMF